MPLPKPFPGRIFFDHLPKTAGVAIATWLSESLGPGCVLPTVDAAHQDVIRLYGGQYSVLCAHAHFAPGESLDRRYAYITCLREPVDRVISWLFFALEELRETQHVALHTAIEDFIQSDGKDLSDELGASISNLYVGHFSSINLKEEQGTLVERSLRAIAEYEVIGYQDDLQQFAIDVASLIGIEPPTNIERANVTRMRPRLENTSVALRSRIEELNELDIQFYERLRYRGAPNVTSGSEAARWTWYDRPLPLRYTLPGVDIVNAGIREGRDFARGQCITFEADFLLPHDATDLRVGIRVVDSNMRVSFATNSALLGLESKSMSRGAYGARFYVVGDLPFGNYSIGLVVAERFGFRERYLAWCDELCWFQISDKLSQAFAGNVNIPAQCHVYALPLSTDGRVIKAPVGSVKLVSPFVQMRAGDHQFVPVELVNEGVEIWLGDMRRPVRLAYRWLSSDGLTVIEGERSALPIGGVLPMTTQTASMNIFSPQVPGTYVLLITMLQEMVGWFDMLGTGFDAQKLNVDVVN